MSRLPLCARVGILHGLIVGFFFSLWRIETHFAPLVAHELAWGVLLLALLAILCSLFILAIVERYQTGAVFWPVVVNAVLVALLTIVAINAMSPHRFFLLLGLWIGIVVGLLMGLVLCRFCVDRLMIAKGDGGGHGH